MLIRQGKQMNALSELAEASKLAPENARYAYVYAIALHSGGQAKQAVTVLQAADLRSPNNRELLSALISMQLEMGDTKTALVYAKKAAEASPEDRQIKQLIEQLSSTR